MRFLSIASILILGSVFAVFTSCSNNSTNPDEKMYYTLCSTQEVSNWREPAIYESFFRIKKLFTWVDDHGIFSGRIYMNKPIADSSVQHMVNYTYPSMLTLRKDDQGQTRVYGLIVLSLTGPVDKGAEGLMYDLKAILSDLNGNLVEYVFLDGDRVLFNVPWSYDLEYDGNAEFDYTSEEWAQLMAWSKLMAFNIASSSDEKITGFVGPNIPHVLKENSCSASL